MKPLLAPSSNQGTWHPCRVRRELAILRLLCKTSLLCWLFNVVNVAIWWVVGQLMDGVNLSFFSPLLSGTR